jgi:hypothetical protein
MMLLNDGCLLKAHISFLYLNVASLLRHVCVYMEPTLEISSAIFKVRAFKLSHSPNLLHDYS